MGQFIAMLLGKRAVQKAVSGRVAGSPLDVRFGFALLRDRRIPVISKLLALALGAALVAALIDMEAPLELMLAALLPAFGLPMDVMVDSMETVVGPVVVASLLLPYISPRETVTQIREERAGVGHGAVIDAELEPRPKKSAPVHRLLRGSAR